MSVDVQSKPVVEREDTEFACHKIRKSLKSSEQRVRRMLKDGRFYFSDAGNAPTESYEGQHDEMKAQIMRAVRALEDARMRLGKVLQYAGDGVSVYDKK